MSDGKCPQNHLKSHRRGHLHHLRLLHQTHNAQARLQEHVLLHTKQKRTPTLTWSLVEEARLGWGHSQGRCTGTVSARACDLPMHRCLLRAATLDQPVWTQPPVPRGMMFLNSTLSLRTTHLLMFKNNGQLH